MKTLAILLASAPLALATPPPLLPPPPAPVPAELRSFVLTAFSPDPAQMTDENTVFFFTSPDLSAPVSSWTYTTNMPGSHSNVVVTADAPALFYFHSVSNAAYGNIVFTDVSVKKQALPLARTLSFASAKP